MRISFKLEVKAGTFEVTQPVSYGDTKETTTTSIAVPELSLETTAMYDSEEVEKYIHLLADLFKDTTIQQAKENYNKSEEILENTRKNHDKATKILKNLDQLAKNIEEQNYVTGCDRAQFKVTKEENENLKRREKMVQDFEYKA